MIHIDPNLHAVVEGKTIVFKQNIEFVKGQLNGNFFIDKDDGEHQKLFNDGQLSGFSEDLIQTIH